MPHILILLARGVGAAAALTVAVFACGNSIRAAERNGEAGVLSGLNAFDGQIRLQFEREALANDPNHRFEKSDVEAIRSSLKQRPLNAQAISMLGLVPVGQQELEKAAGPFMILADRLTRREPLSQMWMIEESSAAGDVPGAVRHYHTALAANPDLYQRLFPVLISALDFPEVQKALNPYFRQEAPWMQSFLSFAASNAKVESLLGMFGGDQQILRAPSYAPINAEITLRLAQAGRTDDALSIAHKVYPDLDIRSFQEIGFTPASLDPRMGKLGWSLADNSAATAEVGDAGTILVSIEPSSHSDVISRYFITRPGARIRFSYNLKGSTEQTPSEMKWTVTCAMATAKSDAPQSWEQPLPAARMGQSQVFDFPGFQDCSLIHMRLDVTAPEGQTPTVFMLSNFNTI